MLGDGGATTRPAPLVTAFTDEIWPEVATKIGAADDIVDADDDDVGAASFGDICGGTCIFKVNIWLVFVFVSNGFFFC